MRVKKDGLTLLVQEDKSACSPRDFCDYTVMLCWHRRYRLGDENTYKTPYDFFDDGDVQNSIFALKNVYMYDHSGLSFSTSPFPCKWDSGQVGIIYMTKEDAENLYGDTSESSKIKALEQLENEIKEYDEFFNSNFYAFVIEDENGEILEHRSEYQATSESEALINMREDAPKEFIPLFDKALDSCGFKRQK